MIYLIQYDRRKGKVESLREFENLRRNEAQQIRLSLEIELNRSGLNREVVLLEAANRAALERTHRRYFADLADFLKTETSPAA
jgi:hypothetical protein